MVRNISFYIIASQILIIPLFFSMDKFSKIFLFSMVFLIFILFRGKFFYNYKLLIISIFILGLFSVSSLFNTGLYSFLFLFLLLIYGMSFLNFNNVDYTTNIFFKFYSVFIVVISLLGAYEFFSSLFLGASNRMLIPYLLPKNNDLRVAGIYGQPNLFALVLLTGILVLLYLHLHSDDFFSMRFHVLKYLPYFTVASVFFLTGSRAGILALMLTYLPLCWFVVRRRYLTKDSQRQQFVLLSGLLFLAYVLSYFLNWISPSVIVRHMGETGISADARFVMWTSAILIFVDHPWFGVGLGNFKFYFPKYVNQAHDFLGFVPYESMGHSNWAHNELLQLLSEGGIFVFILLLLLLGFFIYQLYLYVLGRRQWSPLKLYSHMFLLPFFIQSMFSWPLRHPALLILFFTFLGILLSQYSFTTMEVPRWGSMLLRIGAGCGMLLLMLLGMQEIKMGSLVHNMDKANVQANFTDFAILAAQPYSKYPILAEMIPRYVPVALREHDVTFAGEILPYAKQLVDLQGAHWQWYSLALTYHVLDREKEARFSIDRAIELSPSHEIYWSFLHYLNMLKASRDTGRPVEEFYPNPPDGHYELPEIFRGNN